MQHLRFVASLLAPLLRRSHATHTLTSSPPGTPPALDGVHSRPRSSPRLSTLGGDLRQPVVVQGQHSVGVHGQLVERQHL